uniref:Uncharacterized protein n=1 Tax=Oryza nivara TaxID=4536 RepID=A0A0E0J1B0_ORYNI
MPLPVRLLERCFFLLPDLLEELAYVDIMYLVRTQHTSREITTAELPDDEGKPACVHEEAIDTLR